LKEAGAFFINHKGAKTRRSVKAFHAKAQRNVKAQRKGKEDGRLYCSHFLRVSFSVPAPPWFPASEKRKGGRKRPKAKAARPALRSSPDCSCGEVETTKETQRERL
jgi:hypothetical protein